MATYTENYNLVKPTMAESADIRTINGNMDSVDNIMHATQVSLAPAYDSSETYNTGDIVMYEFLMYECLDDEVTGTWDATKWQRTTAGEHGGGGGGSDVSITPTLQSGTKIADFEIDGVSGALYAPSGGGGGGGETVADILWDGNETVTTSGLNITLNHSVYDYDFIAFTISQGGGYDSILTYPVTDLANGESYINTGYYGSSMDVYFDLLTNTTMRISASASAYPTTYKKIVGLKFGGGSGVQQISWIDYNQLTPAEKSNGNAYFIPDAGAEPTGTVSGAVAHFEDGSDNPLIDLKVNITASQSGSGTPSPSNPRPISGWTGAEIHVADGEEPHVVDNEYNISWQTEAGEVFGGTLDVTSGELTVDSTIVDLGSLNWTYESGPLRFLTTGLSNTAKLPASGWSDNLICSNYAPANGVGNNETISLNSNGALYIKDTAYTDATAFKTAMNGVKLVYKLKTPLAPISLTPTQISSLLGTNNIWADAGNVEVEYWRNPVDGPQIRMDDVVYAQGQQGGGDSGHTYSTEEKVVGTWVDGKTIYERSIPVNLTIRTTSQVITSSVDISNMRLIVSMMGNFTNTNDEGCFPITGYKYNGNLYAKAMEDALLNYITIQYTKITD